MPLERDLLKLYLNRYSETESLPFRNTIRNTEKDCFFPFTFLFNFFSKHTFYHYKIEGKIFEIFKNLLKGLTSCGMIYTLCSLQSVLLFRPAVTLKEKKVQSN